MMGATNIVSFEGAPKWRCKTGVLTVMPAFRKITRSGKWCGQDTAIKMIMGFRDQLLMIIVAKAAEFATVNSSIGQICLNPWFSLTTQ